MFQHYDDHRFKKIIDNFILSSSNDTSLSCIIRNIDHQATKLGISFYHMIYILIQKDSMEKGRKRDGKEKI
jgi:hypothetical protein